MNVNETIIVKLLEKLNKEGKNISSLPTAIYARKSTKDVSQVSIEGQVDACLKFIEDNPKLKLVKTYSEENKSGYHLENRKEMQALIKNVKNGEIKVIVAYSMDRISRNIVDGSLLDEMLEELGATILYVTQTFGNSAFDNFNKNILRAVDQLKPEETAEETMRSMLEKTKEFNFNGGPVPYGYNIIEGLYTINKDEEKAVKMMFDGVIAGQTIPEIIESLTSKGFFTRKQKAFAPQTVHRILRCVKYKGTYLYNDKNAKKRKDRVLRLKFDEVRIPNGMPGIIDENTFDTVQRLLNTKTPKPAESKSTYSLTGKITCGCCNNTMHGYASFGGKNKIRYTNYTCRGGNARNACNLSIRQEYIERATAVVIKNVLDTIKSESCVSKKIVDLMKKSIRKTVKSLTNEINANKVKIDNLIFALANSSVAVTNEAISNKIADIQKIIDGKVNYKKELQNELKQIDEKIKKYLSGNLEITVDDILNDEKTFRKLVSLLIKEITITKNDVSFELMI